MNRFESGEILTGLTLKGIMNKVTLIQSYQIEDVKGLRLAELINKHKLLKDLQVNPTISPGSILLFLH